ncbi:MAG TPA: hypothetical protein VNB24_10280 [Acidimicrobiales bacterium]|nr:hypothetical protein [Acidimicrobiales bacterium]
MREHLGGGSAAMGGASVFRPSFGVILWIVIGILVASSRGYLNDLNDLSRILSALLAVIAWPLVLLNINVAI